MATLKIYRSHGPLSSFVKVGSQAHSVTFHDTGERNNTCEFRTSSEALQNALEHSPSFNRSFFLHMEQKEETEVSAKKQVHKYDAEYPEVKKIQDAIKVLTEKYGVVDEQFGSKKDVLRKASELNISFPNL